MAMKYVSFTADDAISNILVLVRNGFRKAATITRIWFKFIIHINLFTTNIMHIIIHLFAIKKTQVFHLVSNSKFTNIRAKVSIP